jgi:PKD repeat protein
MKTLTFKQTLISILGMLVFAIQSVGQTSNDIPCGSDHKNDSLFQNDPRFSRSMFLLESRVHAQQQLSAEERSNTIHTLPVVVHVIHEGEPYGQGSNITDEQIFSAIDALNDDFRKVPGTNGFGNGVDVQVQFCLASRNPQGQPTTGIVRVNGSSVPLYAEQGIQSSGGNGANEAAVKALSTWPRTSYVNIWIVNEIGNNDAGGGVQGYAYFPFNNPVDGIVVLFNAFGTTGNLKSYTNMNRTLTHEVGHYLGLYHTFHDTNSCTEANCNTGGDRVCDTPPTTLNASCSAPACGGTQQVQNYLDYTSQTCQNMFTEGQKVRMRTTLEEERTSMLTSLGCMPVYTRDAGITGVISPTGTSCNTSYNPVVTLTNFGSAALTSVTINYNVNGVGNNTFSWTGSLASGASTTVNLPAITVGLGNLTFYAFTSNPNGLADENASNNQSSSNFNVTNGATLTLSVTVDFFGAETTWEIRDQSNNLMDFGGPYVNNAQGTVFTEPLCLPNGCYNLIFYDAYGDGQSFTNGSFTLRDANNVVLVTRSGNWGAVSTNPFCVTGAPEGAAPTAAFTVNDNLICAGSSVNFTFTGTNAPTSYAWAFEGANSASSSVMSPQNITYPNAGTYDVTLTVSNEYGSNTYTCNDCITVSNAPTVSFSISNPTCFGGNNGGIVTTTTGGNAPYTYAWVSGPTTANRTNLAAGSYNLVVTDAQGCVRQSTATISQPTAISVTNSASNVTCAGGNDGSISVNATGGTGNKTFAWSNGMSGNSIGSLSAGSYTVTVTDANGCVANQTINVSQPPVLQVSVFHSDLTCNGSNDGNAVASSVGGTGAISFTWSNGTTGQFITDVPAGVYIITATDANGCTDTESFIIEQPDIFVANVIVTNPETCAGNDGAAAVEVEGGNGDYNILWGDGTQGSTLSNVSAGQYSVAIADASGCALNASVSIPYECEISVASTGLIPSDCGLENAALSTVLTCEPVENASMYQWKFATATGLIIAEEFTIGNQFYLGQSTAITNNLYMIVTVKAMVNSVWGNYGQACVVETEQVLGTTELAAADCGSTINAWDQIISATAIENAAIYEWSFASTNGIITTTSIGNTLVISPSLGLQNNTEYVVTVRAEVTDMGYTNWGNPCSIELAINSVGVNEINQESVIIYPNPSDGESFTMLFNEESSASGIEVIQIYNSKGQLIETFRPAPLDNSSRIDYRFNNKLSSGIYFVQYQKAGLKYEEKLIVR